jgi:diacylglycerol kinase
MTKTTRYSRNDMVDAFAYSIEALKVQKARNLRRHKIRMIVLTFVGLLLGGLIAWLTNL